MTIKEEKALKFQKHWLEFDKSFLLDKLKKYWVKYRFLNEIKKVVDFKNKKILDIGCAGLAYYATGDLLGTVPEFCEATRYLAENISMNKGGVEHLHP